MSLIDSELQGGLREMESAQADSGVSPTVTIGSAGAVWPCSKNTNKEGNSFEVGGKQIIYDFALRVRLDAVSGGQKFSDSTLPVVGNKVTHDGTEYRIEFVDTVHGSHLTLLLATPSK